MYPTRTQQRQVREWSSAGFCGTVGSLGFWWRFLLPILFAFPVRHGDLILRHSLFWGMFDGHVRGVFCAGHVDGHGEDAV
jgi:hypothetical protein